MAFYSQIAHNVLPPLMTTSSTLGRGAFELIKSITASSDSDITFADGSNGVTFDSTFKTYCFKFIDIHGSVNFRHLGFDIQVSGGSGFDEPKISSGYEANHSQTNNGTQFQAATAIDLIDSTNLQAIIYGIGSENDEAGAGELWLFLPSDTAKNMHFISQTVNHTDDDKIRHTFMGGYTNEPGAIDEIRFKMSEGNIDSGTIKMYGIR